MRYFVRAHDAAAGQVVSLELEALDERDVHAQLQARQVTPLSCAAESRKLPWPASRPSWPGPLFAQELLALTQAGLGLIESLETLAERERAVEPRAGLQRLASSLREGLSFSAALRAQGERFAPLFVGVVEAGERTGDLVAALERYLAYQQQVQAVRQRVLSAAIYPVILLVVGGLVALFLLGWVVPRFAAVYAGSQRELPWGSQLLLQWGRFAGDHFALILAGLGAASVAAAYEAWTGSLSRMGQALAPRVPSVGRWLELLALSRLYLTLGLLLHGGLPVTQAMALARSVLPASRRDAFDRTVALVTQGQPLSEAFGAQRFATPVALRLLRAGERSGQLAEMLTRSAQYHDAETARWVERFSRAFEPALMAAIGLVIGLIVLMLYMPIFDLASSLQ